MADQTHDDVTPVSEPAPRKRRAPRRASSSGVVTPAAAPPVEPVVAEPVAEVTEESAVELVVEDVAADAIIEETVEEVAAPVSEVDAPVVTRFSSQPEHPARDELQKVDVLAAFGIGQEIAPVTSRRRPRKAAAVVVPDEPVEEIAVVDEESADVVRLPATALLFQAPAPVRRKKKVKPEDAESAAEPVSSPASETEGDAPASKRAPRRRKPRADAAEVAESTDEVVVEDAPVADEVEADAPVQEAPATTGRARRPRRRATSASVVTPGAVEANDNSEPLDVLESFGAIALVDGDDDEESDEESGSDEGGRTEPRRRRRRGGRGRKRTPGEAGSGGNDDDVEDGSQDDVSDEDNSAQGNDDEDGVTQDGADSDGGESSEASGSSRRRRRRRGRRGDDATTSSATSAPSRARDEVTALKGSTRLEAKRLRRREGRDAGRRRTVISEAEFLARRESVDRAMVVREIGDMTQIAVLEDNVLVEHYVAREQQTSMVGNVYLGRVQNVLPSMEAAFVDLGKGRNAVLYAGEVNWEAAGLDGQPRRIEQALKSGDQILVQVTKDPIGHKGARLTSQITLAGRYLVLVPSGAMTGISRKLPDTERARLKKLLKEIVPEGQGVIVRTAAEGASEEELRGDVERLSGQWAEIQEKSQGGRKTSAPVLLKGEPELALRVVRDVFNEDFSSLTVSGHGAWTTISEYVTSVAPDLADRLHNWAGPDDVFASTRIDEQLAKGMDRKVWLPSGGSLVIDRTEAMTVVDVNTGKFTGTGGTLEETVTRNNLEAAEEIVRQLRLRDIGGIIVIDFIDMVLESNRDLVLRRLIECLGRDRTRHQVAEVTSLGLVQMTRKRVGQGLVEAFSTTCEHCHGRGFIVSAQPQAVPHVHVEEEQDSSDDDGPRAGRRRGRGSRSGTTSTPTTTAPTVDPIAREAVRATLAQIAAAAAHAHEGEHHDAPADVVEGADVADVVEVQPVVEADVVVEAEGAEAEVPVVEADEADEAEAPVVEAEEAEAQAVEAEVPANVEPVDEPDQADDEQPAPEGAPAESQE